MIIPKMYNLITIIESFFFSQASAERKPIGSTSGMQTSVETSCLLKVCYLPSFVYFRGLTLLSVPLRITFV